MKTKKVNRKGIYRESWESREERLQPKRDRKPLEKDQCTYCKESGHWAGECPNRWKLGSGNLRPWEKRPQMAKVLALGEDNN